MNPEHRRQWIRMVLGWNKTELSSTHKNVLIALETYADYRTGGNAHPGVERLAADCGIGERAVRYALDRAQGHDEECPDDCQAHLGLIERTHKANSRAGRAAVYRLTVPTESGATTGTTVPPNGTTTGTTMPVDNATTGTPMPVNEATTGTAAHHDRHGHDITTGMAVPPTLQAPSILKHQLLVSESGTSPAHAPAAHTNSAPSRFCDQHPMGTRKRCPDCGNARTSFEAWQAASAVHDVAIANAQDRDRRTRRQLIDACHAAGGLCDDFGRVAENPDADSWDIRLVDCTHPLIRRVENVS